MARHKRFWDRSNMIPALRLENLKLFFFYLGRIKLTWKISDPYAATDSGMKSKIWKRLMRLIALPTWIRAVATSKVSLTCSAVNCGASLKGGMFSVTPSGNRSSMLNPLSATMESPGFVKIPLAITAFRSEVLPAKRADVISKNRSKPYLHNYT